MLTRENIGQIIAEHDYQISELKAALQHEHSAVVRGAIEDKLSFYEDNVYRYRLQAKAWGMI